MPERKGATTPDAVLAGIAAGMLAGLLEVGLRAYQVRHDGRFLMLTRMSLWAIPTVLVVLGTLLLVFQRWIGRLWAPLASWPAIAGVAGLWAVTSPLLVLSPRIHPLALGLIAVGLSVQLGRLAAARPASARRWVRRLAPPVVVLGVLILASAGWAQRRLRVAPVPTGVEAPGNAPNILLLVLDTVRAEALSLYGYSRPTTPFLEAMASESVVFDWAISPAPWTLPSHATMFTGLWPSELEADWLSPLEGERVTLAEMLRSQGYRTGGFVANLQATSAETGVAQGFERYEDRRAKWDLVVRSSAIGERILSPGLLRRLGDWSLGRTRAPEVGDAFLRWQGADDSRPFFAFLNFFDAHIPYDPSDRHRGRFSAVTGLSENIRKRGAIDDSARMAERQARYDEAIATIDDEIRRIVTTLGTRGVLANTIVVVTADHGELFGEHGLQGHGHSLYANELHVPLLFRVPGADLAGIRVGATVTLRDLGRTILALAGLDPTRLGGASLVPIMNGDSLAARSPVLSMVTQIPDRRSKAPVAKGDMVSIIDGDLHYILNGDSTVELHPLRSALPERVPLTAADPERLRQIEATLWSIWQGRASRARPLRVGTTIAPDDE